MIQIRNYRFTRTELAVVIVIAVAFVVSLVFFLFNKEGIRRICYFESLDKAGIFTEIRYMPTSVDPDLSVSSGIHFFVDDLLLGPLTHRYRPLFVQGTRAESCFVRDDVLYVDLSSEALGSEDVVSSIEVGTDIFTRNILKNFPQIKKVELFINGKKAYEEISEV